MIMKLLFTLVIALLVMSMGVVVYAQDSQYKISVFFWHESSNDFKTYEGIKDGFKTAGVDCVFDVMKAFGEEHIHPFLLLLIYSYLFVFSLKACF